MTTALATVETAIVAQPSWKTVLEAFLSSGVDSDNTRRAYRRHLEDAFEWFGVESISEIDGSHLTQYRAKVMESGLSPASQSQALSAVRAFLSWVGSLGGHRLPKDVTTVALRTPRSTVQRPYSVLSDSETATVLRLADNPRDKALLGVMFGAGLRVAEVSALDVQDVLDIEGETILHVRQGKGRKDRSVPIHDDVSKLIRDYLVSTGRKLGDAGPLFRAHDRASKKVNRGRLTTRSIAYVVERYAKEAGIDAKAVSPHTLRHTYAIRALKHGGNVVAVSKLLGHASVVTTQKYVDHLALSELRQAVPTLPY